MALGEEEIISLLNRVKYLSLRHISEPEENSLRLVVEEEIADHTETVSNPDPASPVAEIRKGAAPIKAVEGCRTFELQWSRYVAYLVTEEIVGSGGSYEDEVYTGNLLRVYTKSHFLDHLARDTGGHFEEPQCFDSDRTAVGTMLSALAKTLVNTVTSTLNDASQILGRMSLNPVTLTPDADPGFHIPQFQPSSEAEAAAMKDASNLVTIGTAAAVGAAGLGGAGSASTAESIGSTAVKEGIYEGADASAPGRTYVGQSGTGNMPERLAQHEASGKFPAGTNVSTTEVKGGKTAREIAEQKRINELGGVRSKQGSKTSNQRNPIGPKRKDLMNK